MALTSNDISEQLQIDATHLKVHRTAACLAKKRDAPRNIGRTTGGLNSKLHAGCDEHARPVLLHLTAGQVSDYKGAAALVGDFPPAGHLLADRGYDADWFREALLEKKIIPCIPPGKNRKQPIEYDKILYRQRHKVENMFGKLKDWRRIATRYDCCAHTFMAAIKIAAIVIWWIS